MRLYIFTVFLYWCMYRTYACIDLQCYSIGVGIVHAPVYIYSVPLLV